VITLVVSRFNEHILPVGGIVPHISNTLIIDKGGRHLCSTLSVESIENKGFEAQSWAYYFERYYEHLSPWTVCLQSNPWDHVSPEIVSAWVTRAHTGEQFGYAPLSMHCRQCEVFRPDHTGIPLANWWHECNLGKPPGVFMAWFGGQFIVHRDQVRRRPRALWRKLADTIITKEDACCMERLWQFLFVS
jgi:hypothetical protein